MRLLPFLGLILPILASPTPEVDATATTYAKCKNPKVRREWRSLTKSQRLGYISAVKCLMEKPAKTSKTLLPGAGSRYEDFLGTHIVQADDVHFVGIFYPYHRLYMHVYEKELECCGWSGGVPYWDWTLDVDNFAASPIFDPVTGFGGNGPWVPGNFSNPEPGLPVNPPWDVPDRTGGGCIPNGPFKALKSNLGPGANIQKNPHCVRRDFAPASFASMAGPAAMAEGMAQPDYGWFEKVTEPTFHAGGHWGVGGLYGHMTDKWASPADPLFYIHHSNVDRAWWSWQTRNLNARKADMSGPLINFDYGNQAAGNATLNTDLFVGLSSNIKVTAKVRDVMHIQENILCYTYDKLY